MAELNPRPMIFAMSNPTTQAECTAEVAFRATGGRVVFASGSPFAAVEWAGRRHVIAQANNAYVFPGVGLGVMAGSLRRVTDEMFLAAADALARLLTPAELASGAIYPGITRLREVSVVVAEAVVRAGMPAGEVATPGVELAATIRAGQYQPKYPIRHAAEAQ
jgi:malate dehydrogenase (oxaloacetate-decarboxylating)(NADP+)